MKVKQVPHQPMFEMPPASVLQAIHQFLPHPLVNPAPIKLTVCISS